MKQPPRCEEMSLPVHCHSGPAPQEEYGEVPGWMSVYGYETIFYTAHWDHLGIGKPDANGNAIYNGAVDNGTGISQLIEQARAFAAGRGPSVR
jgi:hypothetical protein